MKEAFRIFTEIKQIGIRNGYDNHPAIVANAEPVEAKFATEEENTFHLQFPRFLIWLLYMASSWHHCNGNFAKAKVASVLTVLTQVPTKSDLAILILVNPAQFQLTNVHRSIKVMLLHALLHHVMVDEVIETSH
jgi:hypothetical protein